MGTSAAKISVVILSFRNFEKTTLPCFRSLEQDCCFGDWEIIVVDNDSGEDTLRALKALSVTARNVRLVQHDQNRGFAGGMNAGLGAASGDIVCLLNSDTLICEGAIGKLAAVLENNRQIGMVGPVTNEAGNEQKIFIADRSTPAAILSEGAQFANAGGSGQVHAYRLDFCAVALRRDVYSAVGGLDEQFGLGYYDDFDYSLRVRAAGFDLAVAEDVFVYHQGGASFGSVSRTAMRSLLATNKSRIIAKYGEKTAFPHVRDANFSVLRQYAHQSPPPYRVRNRLMLASADQPRSLFKRWRYRRKLAALEREISRDEA